MTHTYAMVFAAPGKPEVLEPHEYELRAPGPGEITVAIEAAGVNFIDLHRRSGVLEDGSPFPRSLGMEGAGRVIGCGPLVHGFAPGDRVAFVDVMPPMRCCRPRGRSACPTACRANSPRH